MNLEKLEIGMSIKNYKELCELLGDEVLSGCSKKSQIENWKRYFDFDRRGNKFIINEVYPTPLPKDFSKNDVYTKYVQVILTKHLKETNQCYFTTTDLLKMLGFVNENWGDTSLLYEFCEKYDCSPKQAKYYHNQLYMHVMSYCVTAFKRCLNRLSQRLYINWYEVYRVCDIDDKGNISEERNATKKEIDLYTEISYKLKLEMNISYINMYNAKEYFDKLNSRLKEHNLAYMHKAIGISFAKSGIDKAIEVSKKEFIEARKEVNDKSVEQMLKYVDVDIEKDIEKLTEKSNSEYDNANDDFKLIFSKEEYTKIGIDDNFSDINNIRENKIGLIDMYIELLI